MRKISFRDSLVIVRNLLKSQKTLDIELNKHMKNQFQGDLLFTGSGEEALEALIKDFELKNSEIILPSFICSDVFTRVFARNKIVPKIVDCSPTSFNISIKDVKKEITSKTKAILIVHTLGVPCNPIEFRKLCLDKKLLLIEDCAHCISLKYKNKYLGNYGDAAIFSFAKEMPNFAGGLYINNKRKINENLINIKKYNYSIKDIKKLFHKFQFSRMFIHSNSNKPITKSNDSIEHNFRIRRAPKIAKAIFCHYFPRLDLESKRVLALKLFNSLKNTDVRFAVNEKEIFQFSAKSVPILSRKRDMLKNILFNYGINPGIGWTPIFAKNPQANRLWKLKNTPNAEKYSNELLAISLDELNAEKTKEISKIIKEQEL